MQPVFSVHNLRVRREKAGVRFDLHVPSLRVFAGEVAAFVGESGCGKSTLLDVLGLIAKPDTAEEFSVLGGTAAATNIVTVGEAILAALRRRHFGYMLQSGGLLPFLSVHDNIALPCRINGNHAHSGEVAELIADVGLAGHVAKKPAHLSGGQRQRAALARALAHRPAIVLADEPTGAVDKVTAREIRDLLFRCAKLRGAAVLMVTHDEPLVHGRTDRVFGFEVTRTSGTATLAQLREESWSSRRESFRTM